MPVPGSLSELLPNFVLSLPEQEQSLIKNFLKDIEIFILISNKYFVFKAQEEKARVRRPKKDQNQSKQVEQLDYTGEAERVIAELMQGTPQALQPRLENIYLRPMFALQPKACARPHGGRQFNEVIEWPNSN